MAGMNFRDPYESDRYRMEDTGGLLRRLLALQEEQSRYQPASANHGQTQSAPQNPNVRQVSRAPLATGRQGAVGPLNQADDQSSSAYSPFGDDMPAGLLRTSGQVFEESGPLNERPAPILAGFSRIGRGSAVPPMGAGTTPRIPMPQPPNWWPEAKAILDLYVHGLRGLAVPSDDATILDIRKKSPASGKKGGRETKWMKQFWAASRARAAVRHAQFSGEDPGDYCSNRHAEEKKQCSVRYPEYAHPDFYQGCKDRALERLSKCVANDGEPDPTERSLWDLEPDEELYRNLDR